MSTTSKEKSAPATLPSGLPPLAVQWWSLVWLWPVTIDSCHHYANPFSDNACGAESALPSALSCCTAFPRPCDSHVLLCSNTSVQHLACCGVSPPERCLAMSEQDVCQRQCHRRQPDHRDLDTTDLNAWYGHTLESEVDSELSLYDSQA